MIYVLLDTNIYLHCQAFDTLPLKEIVESTEEVSVLLPMQVLRELEKIKDERGDGAVNKRARTVCSKLGDILLENKESPLRIATCEMPPASEFKPGYQMDVADDVILMSAIQFMSVNFGKLVVVSRDVSMLLKAKQLNLRYVKMSDDYLLPSDQEDKEKKQLREELNRLKMRLPAPVVAFEDGSNIIHLRRCTPKEPVFEDYLTKKERDFILLQEKSSASKDRFFDLALYVFNEGTAPTDVFTVQLDMSKLKICKTSHEIVRTVVPKRFQTEEEKNNNKSDRLLSISHRDDSKEIRTKYEDEFESITQGLNHVIYFFVIDLFDAKSGSIEWTINAPALPDPVKGTLFVVVDE